MKKRSTQRLFWKKWPYKVIVNLSIPERPATVPTVRWTKTHARQREHHPEWDNFRRWQKKNLAGTGMRGEGSSISLFLETQDQVDLITDTWGKYVTEVWAPESAQALETMQSHVYDVVREHPWYRRFPVRARILYTRDFYREGIDQLRLALEGMDKENWYAAGALERLLSSQPGSKLTGISYPYGQPYYLYLAGNDDAVMLKLQVGDWIDRFERQRKP